MIENFKYKNDKELKEVLRSAIILIDTREQQNNHILEWFKKHRVNFKEQKLDHGDYSICLPKNEEYGFIRDLYYDREIVIERKGSLDELAGNFAERNRIEKEFTDYKGIMHLLLENSNYDDIIKHNYRTEYGGKAFLATLHSFSDRYDLRHVFMPDIKESGAYIYYTLYYYLRNKLK